MDISKKCSKCTKRQTDNYRQIFIHGDGTVLIYQFQFLYSKKRVQEKIAATVLELKVFSLKKWNKALHLVNFARFIVNVRFKSITIEKNKTKQNKKSKLKKTKTWKRRRKFSAVFQHFNFSIIEKGYHIKNHENICKTQYCCERLKQKSTKILKSDIQWTLD